MAFWDLTVGQRALWVLRPLLVGALALAGLLLLRRMVGDTSRGDAFVAANARRMSMLGLVIVAVTPATLLGDLARMPLLEDPRVAEFVDPSATLLLWPVVVGLVVGVVAEGFRQGTRLREDVEGLV